MTVRAFHVASPEALLVLGACVLFLGGTFRAGRSLWGGAALVSLAVAFGGLLLTWPATPADVPKGQIAELIKKLGADRFAEREAAQKELDRLGLQALPQLRQAMADRRELEISERARRLVESIEGRSAPLVFASALRLDRLALLVKVIALAAGAVLVLLSWKEIPDAHQMMWKNKHPPGNMAVLVNAPRPGCRTLEDAMEPGEE